MSKKQRRESFGSFQAAEDAIRSFKTAATPKPPTDGPGSELLSRRVRYHLPVVIGLVGGIGAGLALLYLINAYSYATRPVPQRHAAELPIAEDYYTSPVVMLEPVVPLPPQRAVRAKPLAKSALGLQRNEQAN